MTGYSASKKAVSLTSVEESREAIEALARRVQALPGEIRWVHAQQDVILATANGVPVRPGVQTARIAWFLKWAARIGLDIVAVKLASLALLVALRCRQSRISMMSGRPRFLCRDQRIEGGRACPAVRGDVRRASDRDRPAILLCFGGDLATESGRATAVLA